MNNIISELTIKKSTIYTFVAFLFLFAFAAFRPFSVGTDTNSYVLGYVNQNLSIQNRNIGYNYFVDFLRLISNDPRFYLIVISFIIQYYIFYAIIKFSKDSFFSILIYACCFYCLSLNIQRQFIVISLFYCFGIDFIVNKKLIKYLVLIFLLTTVHEVSLVFLPLYFFTRKMFSGIFYLVIWILSFILLLVTSTANYSSFFGSINRYLNLLFSNLPNYFTQVEHLTDKGSSLNGLFLDQIIFLSVWYLLVYSKKITSTLITTVLFNIYFTGIILQNFLSNIDVLQRMAILLTFGFLMLVSHVFVSFKYKIVLLLILSVLFYVRFVLNGIGGIF